MYSNDTFKVPEKVFAEWKRICEHGDIGFISSESGLSRPTISNALKTGIASTSTMNAITEYFSEKKKAQKENSSLQERAHLKQLGIK